jgi:hypothetical protein
MASPGVALTVAGGGMTRLRVKGSALKNSLYQLTNGYVTAAQTVKVRPGTFRTANLGASSDAAGLTRAIVSFEGSLHTFCHESVTVPEGFTLHVLNHPASSVTVPSVNSFTLTPGLQTAAIGSNDDAGNVEDMRGFSDSTVNGSGHAGSISPTTVDGTHVIHALAYTSPASIDDPGYLYIVTDTGWAPNDTATLTYPKQGGGTNTVTLDSAALSVGTVLETGLVAYGWNVASALPDFSGATVAITITGAGSLVSVPIPLKEIHFAAPFMGFLYVVAEFDVDSATLAAYGSTYHYWLQSNGPWMADTVYLPTDFVEPTVPNGYAYQATRLALPNPTWTPSVQIAEGDIVEPTVPNGYYFTATAVSDSNAHTGAIEPTWPTTEGATVQEFGDFNDPALTSDANPGTTTPTPSQTITDRYGNPYATSPGTESTATSSVPASTSITTWQPGTLYLPGAVVRPTTSSGAFINAIPNGDFEAGDDGNWTFNTPWSISSSHAYQGTKCAQFGGATATAELEMTEFFPVNIGQSVTVTAYLNPNNAGADLTMWLELKWYDNTDTLISTSIGPSVEGSGYRQCQYTATAPANTAYVHAAVKASSGTSHRNTGYADLISWNLETPVAVSQFLFEAIQTNVGTSGTTQPVWPDVDGNTVVDGSVTWQAVGTSIITWTASPIMKSGDTEPTWPTVIGTAVPDGNMSWTAAFRYITDPNCPHNSQVVAIAQSKVYAADNDIIRFCATTNPLDWTSQFDAGYLPFGLQTYGSEPCAALGLYRSNLVAFNSLGYQMWQIDPDPANMALLDAQPVGCTWPKSGSPVQNDYVYLTSLGIRSLGISGASGNVQAGQFGKNLDPLVIASIAGVTDDTPPRGLFYPGTGQYWLCFGSLVYVQTNNGSGNANSWGIYEFPSSIDYWTVDDGVLYLRSGDLVWQVNANALYDDMQHDTHTSTDVPFTGEVTWPYLDFGTPGVDKDFEGLNIVCDGTGEVAIGYDQADLTVAIDPIAFDGDTLPGIGMIPIPMNAPTFQVRLTWDAGQAWEWEQTVAYVTGGNAS